MPRKVRVQGMVDANLFDQIEQRAIKGRRPMSREVEYLMVLGLCADIEAEEMREKGEIHVRQAMTVVPQK